MRVWLGGLVLVGVGLLLLWQFADPPSRASAPETPSPVGSRPGAPATASAAPSPSQGVDASQRIALPADPPAGGELAVRVYRAPNVPVPGVKVLRNQEALGVTDDAGWVTGRVPPGSYTVTVDSTSLPDGLIAPPLQTTPWPAHSVPEGYFAPVVQILGNQRAEAAIRLAAPSQVVGVVVDTAGQPVAGCHVRLQAREAELYALSFDARSADTGLFTIPAVPAGRYVLKVDSQSASPVPVSPSAVPRYLDVPAGTRIDVQPLVCGDSRARIMGRVVDQDGAPLADVDVVVYPQDPSTNLRELGFGLSDSLATAKTDPSGTFHLAVPPGSLWIQAHPEGSLLPFEEPKRLRRPIGRVPVPAKAGQNDVGTIAAEVSRPFFLVAAIETDEAAVRRVDPHLRTVQPPEVFIAPADAMNDETRWTRLRMTGDTVRYACDTPSPSLLLVIRRRGFPPRIRQVDPTPGETRWQIRYP